MSMSPARPGEIVSAIDPAVDADDARLIFIGHIESPWRSRAAAPKNPNEARALGKSAVVHVDAPWRAGLTGIEAFSHIIVLYWMHEARRDVIVQAPRHAPEPRGVFALRSPVRPNPIALAVVRLLSVDREAGELGIDAIDCLDGTPLLDIKPYRPGIDAFPDAVTGLARDPAGD